MPEKKPQYPPSVKKVMRGWHTITSTKCYNAIMHRFWKYHRQELIAAGQGLVVVGLGYWMYTTYSFFVALETERALTTSLQLEVASSTAALAEARAYGARLSEDLASLSAELSNTENALNREQNKNEEFEDTIRDLSGTVQDLDKLSKTDEELLQKYSKVYFLNENYIPSDTDKIASKYLQPGKSDLYFHGDAITFLEDMMDAAADDGIELQIVSAYRSFETQQQLKGQYTQVYGSGANAFSADQGYSEHQLGTTVDFTTPTVGGLYTSFAASEAYEWLQDNAHKYGFTESYPEGNSFYIYEPWHWRFVGRKLARDLDRADAHFYDWDQRKIDTYLISIFD